MVLNEQIAALRKEKKMSQEALAEAMGVSRQAISKWENGQCNPDTENVIRLAEVFGVDVNVLIREADEKLAVPKTENTGVSVGVVRILSILLIIFAITTVLFACLWQYELHRKSELANLVELPNLEEMGYESVKIFTGIEYAETVLTEYQQELIAYKLANYHYVNKTSTDPEDPIYGGLHIFVELTRKGTVQIWHLSPHSIDHYSQSGDDLELRGRYEPDLNLLYWLEAYL